LLQMAQRNQQRDKLTIKHGRLRYHLHVGVTLRPVGQPIRLYRNHLRLDYRLSGLIYHPIGPSPGPRTV